MGCVAQFLRSSEIFHQVNHVTVGGSEVVISLRLLVDFVLDLSTTGLW